MQCSHCDKSCPNVFEEDNEKHEMRVMLFRLGISVILFIFARFFPWQSIISDSINRAMIADNVPIMLYGISYFVSAYDVLFRAIKNILHGDVFDENFLMSIASVVAFILGEYPEAVMVIVLYQIGELFQDSAVGNSRRSIAALSSIRSDRATVLRNGQNCVVSPEDVKIGEIIIVKPGERIPLDGVVATGSSFIDTSALTGESVPRKVTVDDNILSGCICTDGVLTIRVTAVYSDSAVARIMDLVENATEKKSKTEKFITRFSRVYTPMVVLGAVLLAVLPPILLMLTNNSFDGMWNKWISRALLFLVVSCPCALVISVPLGFFSGIGAASKRGILIKGSSFLDALAKAKIAVFDKTGTLTKGVFSVTEVHVAKNATISADELVKIATHVELLSNHPISVSLRNAHHDKCCENISLSDIQEISGQGISAVLDSKLILAGNAKLMRSKNVEGFLEIVDGISPEECATKDAGTIIHVAVDGLYMGHIVISDEVKADASKTIFGLKNIGIEKTVMLTGDSNSVAQKIGTMLGIDQVFSDLLPSDKVFQMEKLMEVKGKNQTLLYLGDGINDAPVLARADVGVAMGAFGSDVAIEACDVVIMTDDPSKIVEAVKIAQRTHKVVTENIVFALGIKVTILILGAIGIATMWLAVFADVGVSFLVILNSLRLMKAKSESK